MFEETWAITSMPNGETLVLNKNNDHSYIIGSDAYDHWQDENCAFKFNQDDKGQENWERLLAEMAERAYYGIYKEEGDPHAGDQLCYTNIQGIEGEIGLSDKGWIYVYDKNGEQRQYYNYWIFHAMIPRTSEFVKSVIGHVRNGAREWRNYV